MTPIKALQSDIERLSTTVDHLKVAGAEPGHNQAPALAQYLSQFYTGLESCLEKKLKLARVDVPAKDDQFHKKLLTLGVDSKLIPRSCVNTVVDLLGFRHFARHAYGTDFRLDEVKEKAENIVKIWPELKVRLGNS